MGMDGASLPHSDRLLSPFDLDDSPKMPKQTLTIIISSQDKGPAPSEGTEADRLRRLEKLYERTGLVRSVEAVMVMHRRDSLQLILLQDGDGVLRLPGGYIRSDEDEVEGLLKKLDEQLSQPDDEGEYSEDADFWEVDECIARWWRPNFEPFMYPFKPAHVTKPKEVKKLFAVQMPETKMISIPQGWKLRAVPFYDLWTYEEKYGPIFSAIPAVLSGFELKLA
ncbi:hypothetical protein CALCODRAFT_107245 [Calocera cornea HHB12733]|uniref:Cleavage and polyadenylation specificity factor subunit 5 n=1 Tax=Calocera cornea HHB12733 TaxID=1353952 RepID=A0A165IG38_9BASI|nr:hypothetical protein CALCODRAFT_107245 [Calocera cornea HHB12733]